MLGQLELELMEQKLEIFFRLGVACEDDFSTVACRKVNIEHLNGRKLLQNGTRSQAAGTSFQTCFECDLQTVG